MRKLLMLATAMVPGRATVARSALPGVGRDIQAGGEAIEGAAR